MSLIKVELGGKGVGIADQASIEPGKGCNNGCVGCYAAKTTRMGARFNTLTAKLFDEDVFRKSCKAAFNKGIRYVRMSKHTDPGDLVFVNNYLARLLAVASEEGLQIVLVTKSLEFNEDICKVLIDGNHILHYSLGMITEAGTNMERNYRMIQYRARGVNTKVRLIDDVTQEMDLYWYGKDWQNSIVTPMRYPSKETMAIYGANPENYEFVSGYYRPKFAHETWKELKHWCGEVGQEILCCNCLVGV